MGKDLRSAENLAVNIINYLKKNSIIDDNYELSKVLDKKSLLKLIDKAVNLSGNKDLGLLIGAELNSLSPIMHHILFNCLTIRECFERLNHYDRTQGELFKLEVSECSSVAILSPISTQSEIDNNRLITDYRISSLFSYTKALSKNQFTPLEIKFSYPRPDSISNHLSLFNCLLTFNSPVNALIFEKSILKSPLKKQEEVKLNMIKVNARELITKLDKEGSYSQQTAGSILKQLNGNKPEIEKTANELGLSRGHLENSLQRENTDYNNLTSLLRKELALVLLKDEKNSLKDISYLLGYSHYRYFHKSFLKWTKRSPLQYREEIKYI